MLATFDDKDSHCLGFTSKLTFVRTRAGPSRLSSSSFVRWFYTVTPVIFKHSRYASISCLRFLQCQVNGLTSVSQSRIETQGPFLFCLINLLPSTAILGLLVRELLREDQIIFMPLAQVVVIVSPLVLHLVAKASARFITARLLDEGEA